MQNPRLEAYMKQDRQWFRYQRIGHARRQYGLATDPVEANFWLAVIQANGARL